jgi:hypothetical protein
MVTRPHVPYEQKQFVAQMTFFEGNAPGDGRGGMTLREVQ